MVVLETENDAPIRPVIIEDAFTTTYKVAVEGCEVARSESLKDAILLFGIAHYVFNLKVVRCTRSTMWFLAHEVMRVEADSTPTASAAKNMAEL